MKFEARKTISCEAGEFSYLKKEGENDLNPIIFFHATGLNLETYNTVSYTHLRAHETR